ncbi:MAG TPA: hypothetical protein VK034_20415 [Enhygromyxa sp.]|nr:hypothetical protein [Enhygromyxa sp.]
MSINAEYNKHMNAAARDALCSLVVDHPKTSVAALRELIAERPALGDMTLSELFGRSGAKAKARPASQPQRATKAAAKPSAPAVAREGKKPAAAKRSGKRGGWNTNTAEGRAELDRAVMESLAAFGGVSVSAEALRDRLGATPAQLRASLSRHVEAGDVSVAGKARGTRYTLEG